MPRMIPLLIAIGLALPAAPSLANEPAWRPLFDARSFPRWLDAGKSIANYRLRGDTVSGQPIGHNPENAFLCSPREYRDFELRFDFRIRPNSLNSGVQFRSHILDSGIVAGPQLEMDVQDPADKTFFMRYLADWLVRLTDNPWRQRLWPTGGVYGEALETGWIYPGVAGGDAEAFAEAGQRLTRPDDWNSLRLLARGDRVQTWFNGEPRADFSHAPTNRPGRICLQVHGGEYDDPLAYEIRWRDLQIRVLD